MRKRGDRHLFRQGNWFDFPMTGPAEKAVCPLFSATCQRRLTRMPASRLRMIAAVMILCVPAIGQNSAPGGMLPSYLQKIAARQLSSRRELISRIRTREEVEQRKAEVRRKLLAMMGGLPEERSPLNLRKSGAIDRG